MNKTLDKIIRFFRFKVLFNNLPKKFNNILDIGCGSNPWFLHLTQTNTDWTQTHTDKEIAYTDRIINITAIDSEDFDFTNAPIKFNYIKHRINKNLPFNNEQFDLITMLAVLEHLDYPEEIIKEIYRILKQNGTLIITTPSRFAKPILEFLAFKLNVINKESIASHKVYFDKKSLGKILIDAGFIIEKLNYFELGMNIFAKAKK